MKLRFFLLLLLFFTSTGFGFSIEKVIPNNSTYTTIFLKDEINPLLYKILSNNYKNQIFPTGLDSSSVNTIIKGLRAIGINEIEVFSHSDWQMLVKINTTKINDIALLLNALLTKEHFMPKIKKINNKNVIIQSQIQDLSSNQFIIKQEKTYTLVTMNKAALNAWKSKSSKIKFTDVVTPLLGKKDIVGLFYGIDNVFYANEPQFLVLSIDPAIKNITVQNIHSADKYSTPINTGYFKDNPMFFYSTSGKIDPNSLNMIKNIFSMSYLFIPAMKWPISTLFNNNLPLEGFAFQINSGDIVNINEKKFDLLDMAMSLKYKNTNMLESLITKQEKFNKNIQVSIQSSKNQKIITITPTLPNAAEIGLVPVFLILNKDGTVIVSLNKQTTLEIARNIETGKSSLKINNKNKESNIYIDTNKVLDNFPIINSLALQFGIDLKAFSEFSQDSNISNNGYAITTTAHIKFN